MGEFSAIVSFSGSLTTRPLLEALTLDQVTRELLEIRFGTGNLTAARTASINLQDAGQIYQTFQGGIPGIQGGRVVENHLRSMSADPADSSSDLRGCLAVQCVIGYPADYSEINVTGAGAYVRPYKSGSVTHFAEGVELILSCDFKGVGASIGKSVAFHTDASGDTITTEPISLTGEWQRYAFSRPAKANGNPENFLVDLANIGAGEVIQVRDLQVEVAKGGNNIPGERIHVDAGSRSHRIFGNQNGNSVLDNLVTESVGADLAEAPWLVHVPQKTNLCVSSRDLTTAHWTPLDTPPLSFDQRGIDYAPNAASWVEDDKSDALPRINYYDSLVTPAATRTSYVFHLRKDTNNKWTKIIPRTASSNVYRFRVDNGDLSPRTVIDAQGEVIDEGDWWKLVFDLDQSTMDNPFLQLAPTESSNETGQDLAAMGHIIVGNVCLFEDTPIEQARYLPPIFTSGSTVTRDSDDYSFDVSNWADAQGSFFGEFFLTGSCNVLADFLYVSSGTLYLDDSVNVLSSAVSMESPVKIGFVWGSGTMRLCVNGSWSAESPYSGNFRSGPLDLFRGSVNFGMARRIIHWANKDEGLVNGEMGEA